MLDHQNKEGLAGITVKLLTIHILIALAYCWYLILNTGFFGAGLGGWVIALLVLGLMLSLVAAFLQVVLRMVIQNILGNQMISGPGCIVGITFFIGEGIYVIWALSRDLQSALWVFLVAPLPALIFALVFTFLAPLMRQVRWRRR